MFFKKLFTLILLSGALVACSKQSTYRHYMQNPAVLKQTLAKCQAAPSQHSAQCTDARLVAEVLNQFIDLQKIRSAQFMHDRAQLQNLEQLAVRNPTAQAQQQLQLQKARTMKSFELMEFSVQEDFAKVIMAQESKVAALKQQYQTLKTTSRKAGMKAADFKQASQQLSQLKQQIALAEQKVQVMLALVSLNTNG